MFSAIANSWWMYLLGIIVVLFVLAGSIFFIVRSYRDAKELNMDPAILKRTIINSAIFTILPSISILVGVITLSGKLGVPLPWIRLTVIGALHYEGLAATAPYGDFTLATLTPEMFVTICFVMTLGILSGPLFCLFGFKTYDKKILAKAKENPDEEVVKPATQDSNTAAKPKKSFGSVLFNAVFIAMISAFIVYDSVKPFIKDAEKLIKDDAQYLVDAPYIPIVVVGVTFASMALCDLLEKKCNQKWLSNFSLGLSMIVGMATAVLLAL